MGSKQTRRERSCQAIKPSSTRPLTKTKRPSSTMSCSNRRRSRSTLMCAFTPPQNSQKRWLEQRVLTRAASWERRSSSFATSRTRVWNGTAARRRMGPTKGGSSSCAKSDSFLSRPRDRSRSDRASIKRVQEDRASIGRQ